MHFSFNSVLLISAISSRHGIASPTPAASHHYLTTTAVIDDPGYYGAAALQCWRFTMPFTSYPTIGMALKLADISNITYVVLPPRSIEGLHNPPHPMLFVLLSGMAHVILPQNLSDPGLWIQHDVNPLIVAADSEGFGHVTEYPGNVETVALQLPFKNGVIPEHEVLHDGPCKREKQWSQATGTGYGEGREQFPL